jgi:hypothetical protein
MEENDQRTFEDFNPKNKKLDTKGDLISNALTLGEY